MGDGNFMSDRRVRIYTNNYTFDECVLLQQSILNKCNLGCNVVFDRIGKNGNKQYILIFPKSELSSIQNTISPYMHSNMLYRVGL